MAYGNKYKLKWENFFSETCELYIKQDGYSGAVTNAVGGPRPCKIFWDSKDDGVFSPIIGSHMDVVLRVDTNGQYDEFNRISDKEYKVYYYIDSTLFWFGYVLQGGVSELYNQAPFYITLEVVDELGGLKDIEYLDKNGLPFWFPNHVYSRFSLSEIIGNCLYHCDTRKVYESINIYETNNDTGVGDSMLTQITMHQHAFVDNNDNHREAGGDKFSEEFISCYDVLKMVLEPFGASIMQHNGDWHIHRKNQKGEYTRRIWNSTANFRSGAAADSNDAYTPTILLSNARANAANLNMVMDKSAIRSREEGLKNIKITHDLKAKDNLIDITFDDPTLPPEWNDVGGLEWEYYQGALKISQFTHVQQRYIQMTIPSLNPRPENLMEFSIKGKLTIQTAVPSNGYVPICSVISPTGKVLNIDTGMWETPSSGTYTIKMNGPLAVGEYDFNETVKMGTFGGALYTRFYSPIFNNYYIIKKDDISLKFDNYKSSNEFNGTGDSDNFKELKLDINLGDNYATRLKGGGSFNEANDYYVLKNILFYDTGNFDYTSLWAMKGTSNYKSILNHLASTYMSIYSTAPFKLEGLFKAHFNILSLINDTDELYTIVRLERDEKYCEHEITAIEVGKTQELTGDYILFEDCKIMEAEDGTLIIKE